MTRMIARAYRAGGCAARGGRQSGDGRSPRGRNCRTKRWGAAAESAIATPWRWGEADETWPKIVADAARGKLKDVYAPVDAFGAGP